MRVGTAGWVAGRGAEAAALPARVGGGVVPVDVGGHQAALGGGVAGRGGVDAVLVVVAVAVAVWTLARALLALLLLGGGGDGAVQPLDARRVLRLQLGEARGVVLLLGAPCCALRADPGPSSARAFSPGGRMRGAHLS